MNNDAKFSHFLSRTASGEEVVISGISGRFPCSDNTNEFKVKLYEKRSMVIEMLDRRWITKHPDVPKYAGLLNEVDECDAGFCGLHYKEAQKAEPLERIILEETLKAIMDAGINPTELQHSKTGVFITDNLNFKSTSSTNKSQYQTRIGQSCLLTTQSRIGAMLGLKGHLVNVNTACSSSLTALEHAFKDIRTGQCDFAIVGGGNILQHPGSSIEFLKLGVYNKDGRCKVFDQNADGYVRAEAVTCLFLQRLNTARRVYAKIAFAKINCYGYTNQGIVHPAFESQAELISEVYQESRFNVDDLGYFEFHGTGTPVGDAQEIQSVDLAIGQKRTNPILVGSVKSNMGHAEIASGLVSLVKSIMALESGSIAPNINLVRLNQTTDALTSRRLIVVTKPTPLSTDYIGINNFGIGGANANVLLEGIAGHSNTRKNMLPRIHLASGRNPEAVRAILSQVDNLDYASLLDHLFASDHPNLPYRGFVILEERKCPTVSVQLLSKLENELIVHFGKLDVIGEHFLQNPLVVKHLRKIKHIIKIHDINGSYDIMLYNLTVAYILNKLELKPSSVQGNETICAYFKRECTLEEAVKILTSERMSVLRIPHRSADKNSIFVTSGQFVAHMYETIGSLYLEGFAPQLKNLFKSQFPVKRGTPSISSLVKLNHEKKWNIFKFGSIPSQFLSIDFIVDLKDDHNKFLSGHVVDGLNLLPATWYMYSAWQLLATTKGAFTSDISVLFQNSRFLKATVLNKDQSTKLKVSLNRGSGKYEIVAYREIVACGNIFIWSQEEQTECDDGKREKGGNSISMEQHEIYRELKLRGYQYEGLFRGLLHCNTDLTKGLVKWENNWVAFLDSILHLYLLNLDCMFSYNRLPIGVKQIVIDSTKHREMAALYDNILPVRCNTISETIHSGGVELNGMMLKVVNRNIQQSKPVAETYVFIPNECQLNLEHSLSVNLQIVNETFCTDRLSLVERLSDSSDSLTPLMKAVLTTTSAVSCHFRVERSLKHESNLQMVVGTNLLENSDAIVETINALKWGGFILSCETSDYNDPNRYEQLQTITIHYIDERKFILLRKLDPTINSNDKTEYVRITEDLSWLEAVQDNFRHSDNIILHAENTHQNGILGLIKCLRKEPGGSKILCCVCDKEDLHKKFCQKHMKKQLAVNIYRGDKWGTYRHLPLDLTVKVEVEHAHVTTDHPGNVTNMQWYQRQEPSGNVIQIHCSALNFKDILTATGALRFESSNTYDMESCVGLECAGIDSKGKRVAGSVLAGGIGTTVQTEGKGYFFNIPDNWSFEEAATIPVVYMTVLCGLNIRMNIEKNMSILIHSAAGGIGLAAINIAKYYECEIFVTVSSEKKRQFLKQHYPQLPDDHIGYSRDLSFEQMVKKQTRGRGVDIIINSLIGQQLEASLRCIAKGGNLIEIGKSDSIRDNPLRLRLLENEISYHGIMLDRLLETPQRGTELVALIYQGIELGFIKPLPRTIFKKYQIEDAFRYMMSGKHIGKVVVKILEEQESTISIVAIPMFFASSHTSHIIVGGLGGFGLELANWLISRGARNIILSSRNGIQNGYQLYKMRKWGSLGIKVTIRTDDVSTRQGCKILLEEARNLGPIESIFNLALVLQDALLHNQTKETYENVLKPKSVATKFLDELSREMCPNLKNFVVFSSLACGHGNAGQSNYAMANSRMEEICERRRKEGSPALAIQWGLIADVGYIENMQQDSNSKVIQVRNLLPQKISSCLEVLDRLLKQDSVIVSSAITSGQMSKHSSASSAVEAVLQLLGVSKVSPQSTVAEIGMDSMKSVEILKVLELEFNIFLSQKSLQNMTLSELDQLDNKRKMHIKNNQSNK